MSEDTNASTELEDLVRAEVQRIEQAKQGLTGPELRLQSHLTYREKLERAAGIRLGYGPGSFPSFFETYSDAELESLTPERFVADWAAAGLSPTSRPATPAEKEAWRLQNEKALAESRRRAQELFIAKQEEKIVKEQQKLQAMRQEAQSNGF